MHTILLIIYDLQQERMYDIGLALYTETLFDCTSSNSSRYYISNNTYRDRLIYGVINLYEN